MDEDLLEIAPGVYPNSVEVPKLPLLSRFCRIVEVSVLPLLYRLAKIQKGVIFPYCTPGAGLHDATQLPGPRRGDFPLRAVTRVRRSRYS